MRKTYPTDLSDTEWTRLQSYLPTPKAQGRPRTHSLRDVLDTIFYVLKSGCHWRLLPHDFPPWSTVYYHFRRFRLNGLWPLILKALHVAERKRRAPFSRYPSGQCLRGTGNDATERRAAQPLLACTCPSGLPYCLYSPSCRQGEFSETHMQPVASLCVRPGAKGRS